MIPTKIFFQIHDSRRLLITYWLNDFLCDNLIPFCIVSLVFKLLFSSRLGIISRFVQVWNWTLSTRVHWRNKRTVGPEYSNYIRGSGECSPRKMFENWTLRNAISCIPWIERKIHTRVLLSFSQSLVIHDSRAEVQRFPIPKSWKKDSWFLHFL